MIKVERLQIQFFDFHTKGGSCFKKKNIRVLSKQFSSESLLFNILKSWKSYFNKPPIMPQQKSHSRYAEPANRTV